jgi:catechol 2,3-dioxygenase-like lactoylglutathione lyase family enzyme
MRRDPGLNRRNINRRIETWSGVVTERWRDSGTYVIDFTIGWFRRTTGANRMVRTYGLTHINLVVRDVERSLRFYGQVFGVEEYGRTEGLVHTRTPGCQDVITFDEQSSGAGESRGIPHFGFRLVSPGDIDAAVEEVERAGGKLLRRGEFCPGCPYAYVADPDGYEVEIWYE